MAERAWAGRGAVQKTDTVCMPVAQLVRMEVLDQYQLGHLTSRSLASSHAETESVAWTSGKGPCTDLGGACKTGRNR